MTFENVVQKFSVNWAILTSVTLRGINTENQIGTILQQTKRLEFCDIDVHRSSENYVNQIKLPFLKSLIITDRTGDMQAPASHSILEAITAPILEIFENNIHVFDISLSAFLKRSPHIQRLSLLCFDKDKAFTQTIEILRHCPSLTVLSLLLRGHCTFEADWFLRAFVEEGNDGVICPCLQDFSSSGNIDFSPETLRIFLEENKKICPRRNFCRGKKWRLT